MRATGRRAGRQRRACGSRATGATTGTTRSSRSPRLIAATRRITLAAPHVYSLMQGNPSPRRYRALNVLEELDQPGEFVIDRAAGPALPLAAGRPRQGRGSRWPRWMRRWWRFEDASHVTLRGFMVESGLDNGIEVTDGTECEIVACEVRNLRRLGIRVTGGTGHRVAACDIHHTGHGRPGAGRRRPEDAHARPATRPSTTTSGASPSTSSLRPTASRSRASATGPRTT